MPTPYANFVGKGTAEHRCDAERREQIGGRGRSEAVRFACPDANAPIEENDCEHSLNSKNYDGDTQN